MNDKSNAAPGGGDTLDVHLAEFTRIWAEVNARFDNQRQAFTYLVTGLAALAGLVASDKIDLESQLLLWLPLIVAPLSFIFFDNELMIWSIVRYTRHELHDRIAELVGDQRVMGMETHRFAHLNRVSQQCFNALSFGRWLLFVVPMVVSVVYAGLNPDAWSGSPYVALFLADCVVTLFLLVVISDAVVERRSAWPEAVSGAREAPTTSARRQSVV